MIRATAVCKEYHSETRKLHHRVLSDISFYLDRGEKIAVSAATARENRR